MRRDALAIQELELAKVHIDPKGNVMIEEGPVTWNLNLRDPSGRPLGRFSVNSTGLSWHPKNGANQLIDWPTFIAMMEARSAGPAH